MSSEIISLREELIIKEQEKKTREIIDKNIERYRNIEPCIEQCSKEMRRLFGHPICNLRSEIYDYKLYLYYNILDIEFRSTYFLDDPYQTDYDTKKEQIYSERCDIGIKCARCNVRFAWDDDCSINWFGHLNRVDISFAKDKLSDSKKRYCKICKSLEENKESDK